MGKDNLKRVSLISLVCTAGVFILSANAAAALEVYLLISAES